MKTTLILLNKLLSISIFPAFILYAITAFRTTSEKKLVYYEGFIGFFNDENMIRESQEPIYMFVLVIFSIVFLIRWICMVGYCWGIGPIRTAREISYNVSNILDLIVAYLFTNCVFSLVYIDSNVSEICMILFIIALSLGTIIYKILEVSSSTENEDGGAIELRATIESYLISLGDYNDIKNRLTNSYKDLIDESN